MNVLLPRRLILAMTLVLALTVGGCSFYQGVGGPPSEAGVETMPAALAQVEAPTVAATATPAMIIPTKPPTATSTPRGTVTSTPTPDVPAVRCLAEWERLAEPERAACKDEYARWLDERDVARAATARANATLPTVTPTSTPTPYRNIATPAPDAAPFATYTPVPPDYLPEEYKRIGPANLNNWPHAPSRASTPWSVGGIQYVWLDNPLGRVSYTSVILYATMPTLANNATFRLTTRAEQDLRNSGFDKYEWEVPSDIGLITITDVDGPIVQPDEMKAHRGVHGIVSFTSSLGVSGTLNLANRGWTFRPAAKATQVAAPKPTHIPTAKAAAIRGLTFTDPLHGWLLNGSDRSSPSLARTLDGGRTWNDLPFATAPNPSTVKNARGALFVTDEVGWVYGESGDSRTGWLLTTRDSGTTWTQETRGLVSGILPVDISVWVVENVDGKERLSVSDNLGLSWRVGPERLPAGDGTVKSIIRVSAKEAWCVLAGGDKSSLLFVTRDGALSWQEATQPAEAWPGGLTGVAKGPDGTLWLVYNTGVRRDSDTGKDVYGGKQVFTSSDDGKTWQRKAETGDAIASPVLGDLPLPGAGGNLTPLSAERAFLLLGGTFYQLLRTTDGGTNWGRPLYVSEGSSTLTFVDDQHGWYAAGDTLCRTEDGGEKWTCAVILRLSASVRTGPSGVASVSVSPAEQVVNPGDTFTVDVVVNTSLPSRGASVVLRYESAMLEVVSVSEGDFYKSWAQAHGASTLQFPAPKIDNSAGTVSEVGISIMGGQGGALDGSGPSGSGVIVTYTMKAKPGRSGQATVTLERVDVADADPSRTAMFSGVRLTNGTVRIGQGAAAAGTPTATPTP